MKTSHTPGPWRVAALNETDSYITTEYNTADTGPIARMYFQPHNGDMRRAAQATEANARLIAAAPELLAALVRLTAAQDASIDQFTAKEITEIEAAMAEARAAIAKAGGAA